MTVLNAMYTGRFYVYLLHMFHHYKTKNILIQM